MPAKNRAGSCLCCGQCSEIELFSAGSWSAGIGGSASNGSGSNQVDLDGPVDPSSFITGKEAWHLRFKMKGEVTFTIDSVDYVIDTDLQTITLDGTTAEIGQPSRHLPSSELFSFELRVTPTHAYLLGFGNYLLSGAVGRAHAILTVSRSSNAPNSFSAEWTSATVEDFTIGSSEVAVDESGETPVFTKQCWTAPATNCAYKVVKKLSRNHLYQDDPSFLDDYWMPDFTISGWEPWDLIYRCSTAGSGSAPWATGTVLRCNQSPSTGDGDDPLEPYYTHRISSLCASSGQLVRWYDSPFGGEDYDCADWNFGPAFYSYSYNMTLEWETQTQAAPYGKPYYDASFGLEFTYTISCSSLNKHVFESGGSASSSLDPNDFEDGFTLTITGAKSEYDIGSGCTSSISGLDEDCVTPIVITQAEWYADIGVVSGSWAW